MTRESTAEQFRDLYHNLLWDNGIRSEMIADHKMMGRPPIMVLKIHGRIHRVEVEFHDDRFFFRGHAVVPTVGAFCYEDPLGTEKLLELARSIS